MRYGIARPQIMTGDLIAFRSRRWWSRLIRMRTGSDYTHVGIAVRFRLPEEPEEGVYIADSIGTAGFRLRRLSTIRRFDWIPVRQEWLPPGISYRWNAEAAEYVGRKIGVYAYGWPDIFRAALGIPMREDARQTCQEFVAAVYRRTGLPVGTPQSPGALIDRLRDLGCDRIIEVRQ